MHAVARAVFYVRTDGAVMYAVVMATKKKAAGASKVQAAGGRTGRVSGVPNYPRLELKKVLRIPSGILDQNAGKPCTDEQAAGFAGVALAGPTKTEISSAIKYGLLERQTDGKLAVTDVGKQICRPKTPSDVVEGMRKAVQAAPVISDVYSHFRGEYLPDAQFISNTLVDTFSIPLEKVPEFLEVFIADLKAAELIEEKDGKQRVLDATHSSNTATDNSATIAKLAKGASVKEGDTCFVMMPFAAPLGSYFGTIWEPAIKKAGLKAVRADDAAFGPGKIIDQIYRAIRDSKVLIAELTTKNPNVFYELGLAHALEKPVVLVSGSEQDNPFDLRHIRVIFYDTTDPFWGQKLIDKVAENILSALTNPEEPPFKSLLKGGG